MTSLRTYPESPFVYNMNRIAGLDGTYGAERAANVYAGTTNLAMVGALNKKANTVGLSLTAVLNVLAGTVGLSIEAAVRAIGAGGGGGRAWSQATSPGIQTWTACASNSDGTKLAIGIQGGYIYTSADSGVTWVQRTGTGTQSWFSMAMSADGTYIAATTSSSSPNIWISTDSGATWTQRTSPNNIGRSVVMSASGQYVASCAPSWAVSVSSDYGVTWTQNSGGDTWTCVAMDSTGLKLVAGRTYAGNGIMTSTNGGASWTGITTSFVPNAITSDSTGTKIACVVYGGTVWTSANSGATWTQQTGSGSRSWNSIVSDSTGVKLAASDFGGNIYLSTDSGVTWTAQTPPGLGGAYWKALASSTDGKLIAANNTDYIWLYH